MISNQLFSALLLAKFRKNLISLRNRSDNIKVAQLSDCAFIWSDDSDQVLEFTRSLMWSLALDGLLCRGGIAYGEIVEPEKTARSIGEYICGAAVTTAVKVEQLGKGARIFVDQDFPATCSIHIQDAFKPRVSKLDYKTVDEFCWYLYTFDMAHSFRRTLEHRKLERRRNICELIAIYLSSPKFSWNCKNQPGMVQIASTIDIIVDSYNELKIGVNIEYKYEHVMIGELKRSKSRLNSYVDAIDKDV